jgi:hypothetical protein
MEGIMKALVTLAVLFLAPVVHAEQSLTEILMQSRCVSQRQNRAGQIEVFKCSQTKSDSLQMKNLQATAISLSGEDAFTDFENEATDLSHANDAETEIE